VDRRSESSCGWFDDERALAAIRRISVGPVHIRTPDPAAGVQSEEQLGDSISSSRLRLGKIFNSSMEYSINIRLIPLDRRL